MPLNVRVPRRACRLQTPHPPARDLQRFTIYEALLKWRLFLDPAGASLARSSSADPGRLCVMRVEDGTGHHTAWPRPRAGRRTGVSLLKHFQGVHLKVYVLYSGGEYRFTFIPLSRAVQVSMQ